MVSEKSERHPVFAIRIAVYVEYCLANGSKSPKGRGMIAMLCHRFRLDRARGKAISVFHLFSIELTGYKRSDVQQFVNRVRYVMSNIASSEIKDKQMMYDWLFAKNQGMDSGCS